VKKIIVILVVLLLLLQYKIWLGDGGIPEILQLQKEVDEVQAEANRLKERNKALEAEVNDLKTGLDAIEERARNELGMIGKDEVYYQVIEDKQASVLEEAEDSEPAPIESRDNKQPVQKSSGN
jgi:cell division protein FtsB